MHAGKLALRAIVLTVVLVWVQAASAQGAAQSRQRDLPRLSRRVGICGAARRRTDAPAVRGGGSFCRAACTARRCAASTATRRSPSCRTRTCRRRRPSGSAHETRHHQELHRLPCQGRAGLPGDLSWPGRRHGFCQWRDLFRLPRQPRDPARQQSGVERGAGQPAEDLPEVPSGRDGGLRDVPAARHDRRLRALSLYVDRLEIREPGGRRRAACSSGFIRRFGSTANIATASSKSCGRMCAPTHCRKAKAAISSAGAPCGDGRTCCSRSASSCWSRPA